MDLRRTMSWKQCPQRDLLYRGILVGQWAGHWDGHVRHVYYEGQKRPTVPQDFCRRWAEETVKTNGMVLTRKVLERLRMLRKEADITPEMAERWNEVFLPFIQASEQALEAAIDRR